jgi:NAD(P)H-hydrate repair Nnr-like enzyme with NAD(P)H-hydrate epimerase domain
MTGLLIWLRCVRNYSCFGGLKTLTLLGGGDNEGGDGFVTQEDANFSACVFAGLAASGKSPLALQQIPR